MLPAHGDLPSGGCAGAGDCAEDGCGTVEDGGYRIDSGSLKLASVHAIVCVPLVCSMVAVPEPERSPGQAASDRIDRPLAWVPIWQFVQRAALSPRAPSLAQA